MDEIKDIDFYEKSLEDLNCALAEPHGLTPTGRKLLKDARSYCVRKLLKLYFWKHVRGVLHIN